jgi:hypothetical protein
MLACLPYPDGGAATYENMNVYGISSTAGVKVIPPILGHQSLVCVKQGPPLEGEVGIWEGEVMLALKERHVTSLWTPYQYMSRTKSCPSRAKNVESMGEV